MTDLGVTDWLQQRLPPLAAKNHKEKARLCLKTFKKKGLKRKTATKIRCTGFKSLTYRLRVVTRPLFTQKWHVFEAQTGLLIFTFWQVAC